MENAAEANTVFEDFVDLQNGVVRLLRFTIRHIVNVKYHIRHRRLNPRFPLTVHSSVANNTELLYSLFVPLL